MRVFARVFGCVLQYYTFSFLPLLSFFFLFFNIIFLFWTTVLPKTRWYHNTHNLTIVIWYCLVLRCRRHDWWCGSAGFGSCLLYLIRKATTFTSRERVSLVNYLSVFILLMYCNRSIIIDITKTCLLAQSKSKVPIPVFRCAAPCTSYGKDIFSRTSQSWVF